MKYREVTFIYQPLKPWNEIFIAFLSDIGL